MRIFSWNALKCVSMSDQAGKIIPAMININSNVPSFYLDNILINKCSGSCNNINDPYAKLCVPDVVKNMKTEVFNLMSRIYETRHIS